MEPDKAASKVVTVMIYTALILFGLTLILLGLAGVFWSVELISVLL